MVEGKPRARERNPEGHSFVYDASMGLWNSGVPAGWRVRAAAAALMLAAAGCGGDSKEPSPGPGVITVSGSERLWWNQAGDVAGMRFRAYVDDRAVDLTAAACDGTAPAAACSSPLPPLSNGVHTIALAAVEKLSGAESDRSAPITVQKVPGATGSAGAASTAAFSIPSDRAGSQRLETVVSTSDGRTYAVDVIADGLESPARLAWAPDGRLFVAEANGHVRVIRPGERGTGVRERRLHDDGEREAGTLALDARALLDPRPVGPMGIALHPDFAQNHFVYVSCLAQDSREGTALRVIRLREVGATLGEAATIFEARLSADAAEVDGPGDGPRLAIGPDGLLYVALPPGVEFDAEPTASTPHASMLRLGADGRVPAGVAALEGIPASPVGFDLHPVTGALWAILPGEHGEAVIGPLTAGGPSDDGEARRTTLRIAADGGRDFHRGRSAAGVLRFERMPESQNGPARAFVGLPGLDALTIVTFTQPVQTDDLLGGMFGPVDDIAEGEAGAILCGRARRNPCRRRERTRRWRIDSPHPEGTLMGHALEPGACRPPGRTVLTS